MALTPCPRCGDSDERNHGVDKSRKSGRQLYCFKCNAARAKEWRDANPEKIKALAQEKRTEWVGVKWNEPITRSTAANRLLRLEVLEALGGKCACCGETRQEFLCVDHIRGGGNKHRKQVEGEYFFRVVRREGCPKSKYRVLCYNCNCSLAHRGYCPHDKNRASASL